MVRMVIPRLLTVTEAAKLLKLSARRVSKLCSEGRLGKKVGRNYLIEPADVERFRLLDRPVGNPNFGSPVRARKKSS